jgi:hypothetical protein
MKLEYTELPTMLDVAQAKERGEKIEFRIKPHGHTGYNEWSIWPGRAWNSGWQFRSVREVPVKKVKFLGWVDRSGELRKIRTDCNVVEGWARFPAADVEYEVEE